MHLARLPTASAYDEGLTRRLKSFGDAVRHVRSEQGWSQETLADRAGLHRTYVGSVERGERNVSLGNICAIAAALATTAEALMRRADL